MSEKEMLFAASACSTFLFLATAFKKRKKKRKRSVWVRKILQKKDKGQYSQLIRELEMANSLDYHRYMRMDCEQFQVGIFTHNHRQVIDFSPCIVLCNKLNNTKFMCLKMVKKHNTYSMLLLGWSYICWVMAALLLNDDKKL